jgi:hypothetical protein
MVHALSCHLTRDFFYYNAPWKGASLFLIRRSAKRQAYRLFKRCNRVTPPQLKTKSRACLLVWTGLFYMLEKQNILFGCLEGICLVAKPVLKAFSGQILEKRLNPQFLAGMFRCRDFSARRMQLLHVLLLKLTLLTLHTPSLQINTNIFRIKISCTRKRWCRWYESIPTIGFEYRQS